MKSMKINGLKPVSQHMAPHMAKKVSTCCQSNLIPTTLHPTTKAPEALSVESDSESDDSKGNSKKTKESRKTKEDKDLRWTIPD
ncbi:hypothetical protein OS493_006651 [Desmophyllum pertusum]|uniref:Uncharacterized protein n=1 Tax=Desmophyllum pertusum TaxID=174260 RepID=A0A9X0D4Y1_9CNID|nr:hypothetical protein OS493_006651 [Desmophyllum pertusum]